MLRLQASLVVAVIAGASALANWAYGTVIGNALCVGGKQCSDASQACLGDGACTWCNSNLKMPFCLVMLHKTCDSTGDVNCGNQYSETCINNYCAGFNDGQTSCYQATCTLPPAPPPP